MSGGIHNVYDDSTLSGILQAWALEIWGLCGEILGDVTNLDGDAMRGTDDAALAASWTAALATALGNYTAARAGYLDELAAANIPADIDEIVADTRLIEERQRDMLSNVTGVAAVDVLRVSPDGDDTDGQSWRTAYQTIPTAIDAASFDAAVLTILLIAPGTYDIDTTGDPTYAKNIQLKGSYRNWVVIENNHETATSIMKFTALTSLENITFDCGTGDNNGVIIDGAGTKGSNANRVYFECEDVTGAQTALEIANTEYIRIDDCKLHGVTAYTRGLLLDGCTLSSFEKLDFHDCATGLQITNTSPDNIWSYILLHECTLAMDIDSGDGQFFHEIAFSGNTTNVDDEVENHAWVNIHGAFPITTVPDDLTGVTVTAGVGANTWSAADTQLRAAGANPFRVLGVALDPDAAEKYRVRLTDGTTYFADIWAEGGLGVHQAATFAPSGTEFIFNTGTVISASAKSESGSNDIDVSLVIQEV